ncbi:hypothetical protein BH10ACT9_BH10ACT9_45900 [soil metagenome]
MLRKSGPLTEGRPALVRALVGISFGLGAAELFAPELVAAGAGIAPTAATTRVLRLMGCREICHGLAVLGSNTLVWTRIAGDVVDVALLALGHGQFPTSRRRAMVAAGALTVVGVLDIAATRRYAGFR